VHGDIINTVNTYKVTGEKIFVVETGFSRNFTDKELDEYKTTYRDELELYYKEL